MSTIDPSRVDPTKPEIGDANTATERAQRQVVQDEFTNAKTDIEALEARFVLTADGDLLSYDGTQETKIGVGLDGQVLTARPAAGVGQKTVWETPVLPPSDHNDLNNRDAADGHPIGAVTGLQAALDAKLENVVEDTSPVLGGNLLTNNFDIMVEGASSPQAFIGPLQSSAGAAFAYTPDGVSFDPADGGVTVEPGGTTTYGVSITLDSFTHSNPLGRDLKVSQGGVVYAADPPVPGWSSSDTDNGFYARSGVGLNVWQNLTGLVTTVAQDVTAPDPLDITASVWTNNTTTNRTGIVEIGFGVNGAQPTVGAQAYTIVESFAGYLNFFFRLVTASLSAGDTLSVWVRVTSESHSQFSTGLQFDGSANIHEHSISVPGEGGSGGSGDVIQGTGGATGEVAVWQDFAGKLVHGTGIPAAQVARTDQSQTFTGDQIVVGSIDVEDATAPEMRWRTAAGAYRFAATFIPAANFMSWGPTDGAGTQTISSLRLYDSGGVAVGSPAFPPSQTGELRSEGDMMAEGQVGERIGGVDRPSLHAWRTDELQVGYTTINALTVATATFAADFQHASYRLTAANVTVEEGTANGVCPVYVNTLSTTVAGGTNVTVYGTAPVDQECFFVLLRDAQSGRTFVVWPT